MRRNKKIALAVYGFVYARLWRNLKYYLSIDKLGDIKLDDHNLGLLKLVEPERIDDELYEELDKIPEELLKNFEKGLTAEDAVREPLNKLFLSVRSLK